MPLMEACTNGCGLKVEDQREHNKECSCPDCPSCKVRPITKDKRDPYSGEEVCRVCYHELRASYELLAY